MLETLFNPRSVAIIGASQKALSIGNVITANLVKYGYTGAIYPVNPKADEICGQPCYPSVLAIPGGVDVAHICIPARFTLDALEECGKKGVQHLIINSAGFRETGAAGRELENRVVERARFYGMRVVGPNCQGITTADPAVRAYCNFTFTYPEDGHVSIVAQSGGVGALFMQAIHDLGIGMRYYASTGNACDVSIPEILRFYGDDEKTRAIILYAEGFTDPAEFMDAAREVAAKKPVLGMRSGRTVAGAKAVVSHTGGLAGSGRSTEVLFRKTGILSFHNVEEMCQAAMAFASQPIPGGNRVGLITDTGGPAVIATDELCDAGLEIPGISEKAISVLREKLYPEASVNNPVDVLATGTAEQYRAALDVLMDEPGIDSVYINYVTPLFIDNEAVAREIATVSRMRKKPIVCNYMTDKPQWKATTAILKKGGIPCYDYPETAARALAALTRYAALRGRKMEPPVQFNDVDRARAAAQLQEVHEQGRVLLTSCEAACLLQCYRIPVAPVRIAAHADGAAAAAEQIGYPVVVKAEAAEIVHKTELGGVVLNCTDEYAVRDAMSGLQERISAADLKFAIQQYLPGGREIVIGASEEKGLGHLIMFGAGGIQVELLGDVVFELTPVSGPEAQHMLESVKSYPLLTGFRGAPGVDTGRIVEIIQRVSQLVTDFPMIKEMDLNPVIAFKHEAVTIDARVVIHK
ncbi:MAG: acetate--CoA ligase family protein [Chitinispirillaceae bacterium]|nr:acetate--CoA ligase family protein [Chitinispirillaceae bacterium]